MQRRLVAVIRPKLAKGDEATMIVRAPRDQRAAAVAARSLTRRVLRQFDHFDPSGLAATPVTAAGFLSRRLVTPCTDRSSADESACRHERGARQLAVPSAVSGTILEHAPGLCRDSRYRKRHSGAFSCHFRRGAEFMRRREMPNFKRLNGRGDRI